MKTKVCVKCGNENYTKQDKCVLPDREEDGIENETCQGTLIEAKVYECTNCQKTAWGKIIKVTADNYPKCPACDKSMIEYQEAQPKTKRR